MQSLEDANAQEVRLLTTGAPALALAELAGLPGRTLPGRTLGKGVQRTQAFLGAVLLVLGGRLETSHGQPSSFDTVLVWGSNDAGQDLVPFAAQSGVAALAAGWAHSVALKTDGSVAAWGSSDWGQSQVPPDALSGVTAIAAGGSHSAALKEDGSVVAWGSNGNGQTAVPSEALEGVTAIAAGWAHTVALKKDGSVLAWGAGTTDTQFTPDLGQSQVPIKAHTGVTAIAAGWAHTVALKNDGSVLAWGWDLFGQATVPEAAQGGVSQIAAGSRHTVALRHDGSVVAWGWNYFGQTNVPAAAKSGVTAIAAGEFHTVALKNDGTIVAWGSNAFGQRTVPAWVQGGATAIAAGGSHTVVLVRPATPAIVLQPMDQTIHLWNPARFSVGATGYPLNYQWRKDGLDVLGATQSVYNLKLVQTHQAGRYTVVVSNLAGSVTSAPPAVLEVTDFIAPGTVVAWGDDIGDDGDGVITIPLAAQSGVAAIASGGFHTLALKSDGSVVARRRAG